MQLFEPWSEPRGAEIIAAHTGQQGAALPVLHAMQDVFGHIPRAALPMVAAALNLSRAELYGIVSFYHDFRETPPGAHILKLCRAEACQAMGGEALAEAAQERLGISWGETSADGGVTLKAVFCLGLCACAPAAMLDGNVVGRLDQEKFCALLDQIVP
jgi:formate dehydrogenase subunit gamma